VRKSIIGSVCQISLVGERVDRPEMYLWNWVP